MRRRQRHRFRVPWTDRTAAGRDLAGLVEAAVSGDVVVLGLPRGGVPVAAEVARAGGWPLDVLVVRKVGAPRQPEFAVAAVGEGGVVAQNPDLPPSLAPSDEAVADQRERLQEMVDALRDGEPLDLAGRVAVVVDDGVATGATAQAAVQVARARGAARVVLATPVAGTRAIADLEQVADEVVVAHQPEVLHAVGEAYGDFGQVSTQQVRTLLDQRDADGRL